MHFEAFSIFSIVLFTFVDFMEFLQKIDKSNSVLLLNNVDLIDLNHSLDAVENWGRHRYVHN